MEYPPIIFKCRLGEALASRGYDPEAWVIRNLGVSNVTARRILKGCDTKFSNVARVAELLDLEIDHLWTPIRKKRKAA